MKKIYVTLVELPTFINKYVYLFTRFKYTHFSVSFDKNLKHMYGFQKRNIHTTLIGGLIEENESLYFHGKKNAKVNEIIYEIPVTNEEYNNIYNYIETVKNDKEYIFNYISCWLMFPIHGIKSFKALHCAEFLCEVLKYKKDIVFPKKTHKILSKDIYKLLNKYKHTYKTIDTKEYPIDNNSFFIKKVKLRSKIKKSFYTIKESFCRSIFKRTSKNYDYHMVNLYEEDYIKER